MRVLLSVLIALGAAIQGASTVSRTLELADFELAECPFALPVGLVDGAGIDCGYLTTPKVHGLEDGATVRLAVARIASTSPTAAPEPLILLLGGPGQEVETVLAAFTPGAAVSYRSLLDRQEVILLEQRGIGYSEPSLACPFDTVGGVVASEDLRPSDDVVAAFAECAAELRAAGVDLEAFDSIQSAADVDALRRALGFDQVDLLGISYGSRLALTLMRDFPTSVRGAVLASPLPLQANLVAGQVIGFDAALDRLFASCAAEAACGARYPRLDEALSVAVERLRMEPLQIGGTNPVTGEAVDILVDGGTFLEIVYVSTFIGPLLPFVPALISGVVDGNNVILESLAPYTLILTAGVSLGANYVINCNEEFGLTDADAVTALISEADVRPELRSGEFAGSFETFLICDRLDVTPADASEDAAVRSEVPTLVISGQYDPITPPSYGEDIAETLPNSVTVVIEGAAHDPVSTSGTCGFSIVASFLGNLDQPPDTSCADDAPVAFLIIPA